MTPSVDATAHEGGQPPTALTNEGSQVQIGVLRGRGGIAFKRHVVPARQALEVLLALVRGRRFDIAHVYHKRATVAMVAVHNRAASAAMFKRAHFA
jgi:hypothetical protein